MVTNVQIALGLALALSVIDYISEGAFARSMYKAVKEKLVSFSAGVSVTYIFLHLFPLVYSRSQNYPRLIFLSILVGFVAYHLIEKWIYQHAPRDKIVKEVENEHVITLSIYHFLIGVVLVALMREGLKIGLLYFIPVSLHIIINALPHSHRFQKYWIKALFAGVPLLGTILAILIEIPQIVNFALLGMVTGLLLFLESREVIPEERKGSPALFVLGVVLYGALIIGGWIVGA